MSAPDQRLRRAYERGSSALLLLASLIITGALTGCRPRSKSPPASDTHVAAEGNTADAGPSLEWAGCAGVRKGPICEVGADPKLTFWIDEHSGTAWTVVDDRKTSLRVTERPISGGRQLEIEIPAEARALALVDAAGRAVRTLALSRAQTYSQIEALVARGRSGEYQEALDELEKLRAEAPDATQGPADAAIARMALALGNVTRAEPAFRSAIAAATRDGRIGDAVRDGSALLWALVMLQQRFTEARVLLEQLAAIGETYPEGRVWIDYHAGLLAAHTGDVRTALERFRSAERRGRRVGLAVLADNATMEIALLFTRLGRAKDASTALTNLRPPEERCARSSWAINLAWAAMEQGEFGSDARAARSPDVWNALLDAERAAESCPDPHRRLLALINSATYALKVGDRGEITRLVAAMDGLPIEHDVRLASWRADILGQRALLDGAARSALSHFEEEVRTARGAGLTEEELRGEVGAGQALLRLGRRGAAIAHLNVARGLVERMMREIPVGEGRAGFLGGHDLGVRTLIDALVAGGAARDALRVARETRAAELAQLTRIDRLSRLEPEARRQWDEAISRYQRIRSDIERLAEQDWTLSSSALLQARAERRTRAEEARAALDQAYALLASRRSQRDEIRLNEPAPGELYLAFAPGARAWYAFAATNERVTVRPVPSNSFSSREGAAAVLLLFARELAGAESLRVFPYGLADQADWHMVPWEGKPLAASLPVVYALDVPARTDPSAPTARPPQRRHIADAGPPLTEGIARSAIIVANPTGDLPAASAEADAVAESLAQWRVLRLEGERATRQTLLAALSNLDLLHYAGHAEITDEGGLTAALRLGGNSRMELGDLLATESVPKVVILSACEAAATPAFVPSLLGLGQAFVLAGAQAVLAPKQAVGDMAAKRFVQAFYAALATADMKGEVGTIATDAIISSYRDAIRTAAKGSTHGWESFRLMLP